MIGNHFWIGSYLGEETQPGVRLDRREIDALSAQSFFSLASSLLGSHYLGGRLRPQNNTLGIL